MGRAPCCDKASVKKGPWSPEEDAKLKEFIENFGTGGNWIALPQKAGLKRCGKSCRLRWLNYLRPNIKHGEFSDEEDRVICTLYATIGSRWSIIAAQLPGRTDNDIKNYWNTKLKKKLMGLININPSNQTKLVSQLPFSGLTLNQTQSQSPLSTLSHFYRDNYTSFYSQAAKSLTESISAPQNYNLYGDFQLSNGQHYSNYQDQGNLVDHNLQYYPGKDNVINVNNMLVFGGGNEASCSSSDGSCSQISYAGIKDHHHHHQVIKQEDQTMGFNISNGFEENQKFMLHYGKISDNHLDNLDEKANGIMENSQLECDLEEVKQLIISNNNVNNSSNLLLNDENKTPEMYYCYY